MHSILLSSNSLSLSNFGNETLFEDDEIEETPVVEPTLLDDSSSSSNIEKTDFDERTMFEWKVLFMPFGVR